jgi:hypothetical protein
MFDDLLNDIEQVNAQLAVDVGTLDQSKTVASTANTDTIMTTALATSETPNAAVPVSAPSTGSTQVTTPMPAKTEPAPVRTRGTVVSMTGACVHLRVSC